MSFDYSNPKALEVVRAIRAETGRDFLRLLLLLIDERVLPAARREALEKELGEDALILLLNAKSELRGALSLVPEPSQQNPNPRSTEKDGET